MHNGPPGPKSIYGASVSTLQKVRRRGSRTRLCLTFASGHVTPLPCVGPSGALGWVGHGLSTASPRRPTEAACILYAFFGKAKQCPERGAGALLRQPSSRSFLVPLRRNAGSSRQARQIGPPYEILNWRRFSRPGAARASCAFAWRHKTKAAVSRAAESDCQTDRTRRLPAVIRRRDRSGSSRPRSERRASTVPAAV